MDGWTCWYGIWRNGGLTIWINVSWYELSVGRVGCDIYFIYGSYQVKNSEILMNRRGISLAHQLQSLSVHILMGNPMFTFAVEPETWALPSSSLPSSSLFHHVLLVSVILSNKSSHGKYGGHSFILDLQKGSPWQFTK
jgi:hypothetical protein